MSKRRTHSSIDKLPAAIRDTMTSMVVDGIWPDGFEQAADRGGKPTYSDIVVYCQRHGHEVSHSAVGRWAKTLLSLELLRTRAELVRGVMSDIAAEKASETQKAAAEMITARVLEFVCEDELTAKQAKEAAQAVRDCATVAMKADQYIRDQVTTKAEAAVVKVQAETRDLDETIRKKMQKAMDAFLIGIKKT